ncbi:MAG TPA: cyclase family protein [Solirubrobacterales bacterium]|nr:cyclase family protein [Solirubrobacterales bacterium]
MIGADADRIVDLSVTLSEHLPTTWPEHMPFAHKNWSWFEEDELPTGACTCSLGPYVTHFFILDEHAGTHVDAASHYFKDGDSSEKIDLSKLIGPAAVVDLRQLDGEAEDGASPAITVAHLEAWEGEHGQFEPGEVVLLHTGWTDKHYVRGEDGRAFLHEPVVLQSRPAWPAPEPDAAIFLHERGVTTIGIDAPSVGSAEEGNEVHRAGLSRGMAFIEGLTNLERLPARGASFVFLPLKIAVASGAPGRAIAILP